MTVWYNLWFVFVAIRHNDRLAYFFLNRGRPFGTNSETICVCVAIWHNDLLKHFLKNSSWFKKSDIHVRVAFFCIMNYFQRPWVWRKFHDTMKTKLIKILPLFLSSAVMFYELFTFTILIFSLTSLNNSSCQKSKHLTLMDSSHLCTMSCSSNSYVKSIALVIRRQHSY